MSNYDCCSAGKTKGGHTDLSDGALADLHGHGLELRICGQVEFVVPQELMGGRETVRSHTCIQSRLPGDVLITNETQLYTPTLRTDALQYSKFQ